MRITNNMLSGDFLRNLNKNLSALQKQQKQLASGKSVSKPSDDPMAVSRIITLKNSIKTTEQYNKNISDASGWVDTQDTALSGGIDILQKIREITIYGANDALSQSGRKALEDELSENIGALRDVLNINYDGRYVFGGQETKKAPFLVGPTGLEYVGDNKNIEREIGQGVSITLVTSGEEIIGSANELGTLLNDALVAIKNGNSDLLSSDILKRVDESIDKVLSMYSKLGATSNRLEAAKLRNEAETLNLNSLLSKKEDIDIAEKYMEYSTMSNIYQASLSVGSKILQPGLLDFLR